MASIAPSPVIAFEPAPLGAFQGLKDKLQKQPGAHNTETYDEIDENPFLAVAEKPLSTFSADVDTASYSNVRRFINAKEKIPRGSVRIEEMVNYFAYDYPAPGGAAPFSVSTEVASAPWKPEHRLVRIGLRGKDISTAQREAANLVFLLDVSGSMGDSRKLPLLKRSMQLLVEQLDERDRVAIVVYAGASGVVLESTSCAERAKILKALDDLEAGGSTNGGEGIQKAYDLARQHFVASGINRVILATDGDFNVGVTDQSELIAMIQEEAKSGVFLSVLGYGMGNLKDSTLEKLADKGNGNYAYIDTIHEARKVLVEQMGASLITIAKDVKLQVEFNPAKVRAYRLIGYENRRLADRDFNDDTKDAGEIGAGHRVTALYEIVPVGVQFEGPDIDGLKYQKPGAELSAAAESGELMTVKLRYKPAAADKSVLIVHPVADSNSAFAAASTEFKFAASVAAFGMLLRDSEHLGQVSKDAVLTWAEAGRGADEHGYRAEFIQLVRKSRQG